MGTSSIAPIGDSGPIGAARAMMPDRRAWPARYQASSGAQVCARIRGMRARPCSMPFSLGQRADHDGRVILVVTLDPGLKTGVGHEPAGHGCLALARLDEQGSAGREPAR